MIASYILSVFIGVGSAIGGGNGDLPDQRCSLSTENCTEFFTDVSSIKYIDHSTRPADIWKDRDDSAYIQLMSTSYLFFPLIGTFGTIIFGLISSGIVSMLGINSNEKPVNIDCLSPPFLHLWRKLFPEQMAYLVSEKGLDRGKKKNIKELQLNNNTA